MGNLRNSVCELLNEIMRETWKDCETESLRHELRKANKGLRRLHGKVEKFNTELHIYYDNYWNLRHKCYMTIEERRDFNDLVKYLVQNHKLGYANLLVKLQRRFDDSSNGR